MSSTIALSALPSLLAACVMLASGAFLAERVTLLARFSIPAPIVGGLLFAALTLILQQVGGIGFTRDTETRSALLLLFFASIGLTADLSLLRRGGPRLLQKARGYRATIVAGAVTYRDGEPTGALPGKLVRGPQKTP